MEYTVQKLARMAGISARTLRHYDEIGLLKPARVSSSGYRIYGQAEVELLQQILLYRALEMPLEEIARIVHAPGFSAAQALLTHREMLLNRRATLDILLANVEKTLQALKGVIPMKNEERFHGFAEKMIAENDAAYGQEAREKYGEATYNASNKRLRSMTQQDFDALEGLRAEANTLFKCAMDAGESPASETAQRGVALHHKWVNHFWDCVPAAYINLTQMYVDDPRFSAHYEEAVGPGGAAYVRDAAAAYTGAVYDDESGTWQIPEA